jgi:pimeloyl-ACP methyl ester carboxylesterase
MTTDDFRDHSAPSRDGVRIGWQQLGRGPALVVSPGGSRAGKHYRELARCLASRFTVVLMDRRGRGASGPHGPGYGMATEIEDLAAVMQATGAERVFGHSAGAVFALEAARVLPVRALAVYDPPVAVHRLIDMAAWAADVARAVERGQRGRAMAAVIHGLQLGGGMPRWLLTPMCSLMMRGADGREMMALLGTWVREEAAIRALDPDPSRYADVRCPTLLLAGGKSPAWLHRALDLAQGALPDARRVVLDGVAHNAPDQEAPARVAEQLAAFFADAGAEPAQRPSCAR